MLAAVLFWFSNLALAQATAGGTIEGRVSNPSSGENLERVRLRVDQSGQEAFTDESGWYRIVNVPVGAVSVTAFRTGVHSASRQATLAAGQTVQLDFELSALSLGQTRDGTVQMSEFVVSDSKEMEGAAIAINTQRFAPNIVNVIAADEFGPMATGNVGEVLKSMPGLTLTQGGMGEPNTISINGVPSANVPVTLNGFNFAQAGGNTSRTIGIHQVSLNNISRIEVSFTPTPETPGSALAGTVNMVPRNSFERVRPLYTASASLLMRDTDLTLGKTPGHRRGPIRKVLPGFDFAAIVPVNDRLGFTLTAATSPLYTPLSLLQMTRRGTSADTNGAAFPDTTPGNPYLTTAAVRDATRITRHTAYGATLDYRLSRSDTLTFTFNYALFDWESNDRQLSFIINRVLPGDFSADFTHGAAGMGTLQQFNAAQNVNDTLYMPTLTYRHRGRIWKAEVGAGLSHSERLRRDLGDGIFANVIANRPNVTIWFDDVRYDGPRAITVRDAAGQVVDPFSLGSYSLAQATGNEIDTTDEQRSAFANLGRELPTRIPVSIKFGVDVRQQIRDILVDAPVFPFTGANRSASQVLDESYSQRNGPYYFPRIEWLSNEETFDLYRAHPEYFGTPNAANRHNARTAQSKYAKETIGSLYFRADVDLLEGRLKLVGGLRAEETDVEGRGDLIDITRNWRRDAAGRPILGANGQPLPIATTPLEEAQLTHIERGLVVKKDYARLFPSLNASFSLRDNLIARAGYYRSIGRPDFVQYAGSLTLPNTQNPPSATNRISVNNPGIDPWMAETYRVSLEYYFEKVGVVSVGGFVRDFENFFGPSIAPATPEFLASYGLDSALYGPYDVVTQMNLPGDVRTKGVTFNYKQALTFLPAWARGVQVFANYNLQSVSGEHAASFDAFVPRFGNWGISLSRPKYTLRTRWNYRDDTRQAMVAQGRSVQAGTYTWGAERLIFDVTAEYQLNRHFTLYGNMTNITDAAIETEVRGPGTPDSAALSGRQNYGAQWLFGVKATF